MAIGEAQTEKFEAWHRAREMGPLIQRLSKRCHDIAREELHRTLRKLGGVGQAERQHLEELTRRIVNKLLHDPIQSLRKGDGQHAASAHLLHEMERLFHLGEGTSTPEESQGSKP